MPFFLLMVFLLVSGQSWAQQTVVFDFGTAFGDGANSVSFDGDDGPLGFQLTATGSANLNDGNGSNGMGVSPGTTTRVDNGEFVAFQLTNTSSGPVQVSFELGNANGDEFAISGAQTTTGTAAGNPFNIALATFNFDGDATWQISATGGNAFRILSMTVTVVPEPEQIALVLVLALAMFGFYAYRKQNAAPAEALAA